MPSTVKTLGKYALLLGLLAVLQVAVVLGVTRYNTSHPEQPPAARAPEYVPDQPPGSTVLLVAVLPDSTKVYRIDNPQSMIVPAVVAITPNGHVSFR